MKNLIILAFLCFFVLAANAQKKYSLENLETLSQEQLDGYMDKAVKLQKSGKTVTIVGGSILGATAVSSLAFGRKMEMGVVILAFFGGVAGLGTMAVGIPMNVTGKKRIERINYLRNTANNFTLELKPGTYYNQMTQNIQPGVTLKIRF